MAEEQRWLLAPEDFSTIYKAIQVEGSSFALDLTSDDAVKISGGVPGDDDDFSSVRGNSMAWEWLSAAWRFQQLDYVVWVNGVPFAFKTPFGWSFIPRNHYAAGKLPKDFSSAYQMAYEVLLQVVSDNADSD